MERQPQNPEFRINPENLNPCIYRTSDQQRPICTVSSGSSLLVHNNHGTHKNKHLHVALFDSYGRANQE